MESVSMDRARNGSFWQAFSAALAVLAGRSWYSLSDSPLPEVREAARDFSEWMPAAGVRHSADLG
jgi:hypothetical protein